LIRPDQDQRIAIILGDLRSIDIQSPDIRPRVQTFFATRTRRPIFFRPLPNTGHGQPAGAATP